MAILFTLTVFLSAALLFLVQPMTAKMILPSFGGSPSVWNTSMVFFQLALLAGYGYAHLSMRKLGLKRQPILHLPLIALPLLLLPMMVPRDYNPTHSSLPTALALLVLLGTVVGLPFLMVSTSAPILQRWFGATSHRQAHDPYFLYAASNLGSLLGLLVYPFWIEPHLPLQSQAQLWSWGYAGLVVLVAGCAFVTMREQKAAAAEAPEESQPETAKGPRKESGPETADKPIDWKRRGTWILLAAIPSSLLLGVTNFLTTNISPVPLLWVVPLSLYLLTFVAAFGRLRPIKTETIGRIAAIAITPLAITIVLQSNKPMEVLAAIHLIVFALCALYCHFRLADDRPSVHHLTEFYLWLSVGGVIGGAFNALLAPWAFDTLSEYPLAFVLVLLLRPLGQVKRPSPKLDLAFPVFIGIVTYLCSAYTQEIRAAIGPSIKFVLNFFGAGLVGNPNLEVAIRLGIPVLLAFVAIDHARRYALSLGAFLLVSFWLHTGIYGDMMLTRRSFFGVYRVVDFSATKKHEFLHGNTLHGSQFYGGPERFEPQTYYSRTGPVGDVLHELEVLKRDHEIGLVGLGVGTLSAYGRSGNRLTFFEIDPLVVQIASDPKYFTYLSDAKERGATIEMVLGDARLSLQDQPDGKFDLLVLDAFSSDAIPVHLLTLQAFNLYLKKLTPNGLLAVHISNRYLDLTSPLAKAMRDLNLLGLQWMQTKDEIPSGHPGASPSNWVVIGRSKEDLKPFDELDKSWVELSTEVTGHAWTDDFSDLVSAFVRSPD